MGQDQLDKLIREKLGQHETPIDTNQLWDSITEKSSDNIDSIIKDKLYLHETPIDNKVLWNNISGHIVSTRSYKPYFITAVSIIALAVLSYFVLSNSETKNTSSINQNMIIENTDKEIANTEISNSNSVVSDDAAVKEKISDNHIEQEIITKKTINTKDDKQVTTSQADINFSDTNNSTLPNYNNQANKQAPVSPSLAEANDSYNAKGNFSGNDNNNDRSDNSLSSELSKNAKSTLIVERNEISGLSLMQATGSLSDYMTRSAETYAAGLPHKDVCFRNNKSVECYDYSPKKIHYSVLAYTTADYYMKSLSAIEPAPSNYLGDREKTQKAQVSNRSGLQFKIKHKSGVYVKFGAEIGFLRERFSHETRDTVTEILPDQLLNIDIDTNGDTTRTYGNAPVTTISSKRWKVNNTLRTIGIPVLIGYQGNINKLNIGFEIGALYNINHSFEGWLLGPASDPLEVKDYFITNNDLNLTGGININYELSDRYNAFIMSSFRQNLNNINQTNSNYIDQKNTTLGIGIGIELKL